MGLLVQVFEPQVVGGNHLFLKKPVAYKSQIIKLTAPGTSVLQK